MKAIIFGVTGQDGSHLADLLISKDYEVVGVARRSSVDTTERVKHLIGNDRFDIVYGDITDVSSVMNILSSNNEVDEVYNLAAQSHVGISFKQPGLTWDITGKGVLNILQAIVDLRLHCRFYQASSSEMFGDSYDVNPDTGEKYQNEETKFLPQSPYAIAKCAAHYAVRLYREAYGLHASAGILFNHEGPRRGAEFVTRKIPKKVAEIHHKIKNKDSLETLKLGNIDSRRDWSDSRDFMRGVWLMLNQNKPKDYVLASGETHSVKDFVTKAFSAAGIPGLWSGEGLDAKFRLFQENTVLAEISEEWFRPAEVDLLHGDASDAEKELGWKREISFDKMIEDMVQCDLDIYAKQAQEDQ